MVTVNADDQTRPLLGALLVGKHELNEDNVSATTACHTRHPYGLFQRAASTGSARSFSATRSAAESSSTRSCFRRASTASQTYSRMDLSRLAAAMRIRRRASREMSMLSRARRWCIVAIYDQSLYNHIGT